MPSNKRPTALIVSILIAAAAISGSLYYAGNRLDKQTVTLSASERQQLVEQIRAEVIEAVQSEEVLTKQIERVMLMAERRRADAQRKRRQEQQRLAQEKAKQVRRVSMDRDHIRGDPDAAVSMIEYSDFECPYCKRFHTTPRRLLKLFNGKINWVYRHFPLSFHNPGAQKQAEAAECAADIGGNEAFWKYTDALFQRTRTGGRGFPLTGLTPMAKEFRLDGDAFQACLDSGKYTGRVQQDIKDGTKAGITGTPGTIIINNKTGDVVAISGARPITVFEKAIRDLLKKSEEQQAKDPGTAQTKPKGAS